MERDLETSTPITEDALDKPRDHVEPVDHVDVPEPGHADTGTAAGVGGVTGAAIGAAAGPVGAALGAVGGMVVGAAAERLMHANTDAREERARDDEAEPRAIADPGIAVERPDAVAPPGSLRGGAADGVVSETTIDPERASR